MADLIEPTPILQQIVPPSAQPNTPPTTTVEPVTIQDAPSPVTDTTKALNDLFDKQAPASPVAPAPAPEPTPIGTQPEPDSFEKQLDSIQSLPDDHPNKRKGIEELKRISKEEHQKSVELETKLKDYETKIQDYETKLNEPRIPDEVKRELDSLRELRKNIDIKLDPEFQKQYVLPVQTAESDIMSILKQAGIKEEVAKSIQDNGGIIHMSQSQDLLEGNQTMSDWVENTLLGKTPTMFRNRIIAKLTSALDTIEKGSKEIADYQQNAQARMEARHNQIMAKFNEGKNAALTQLGDLAKPKEIPVTATVEEKASLEAHNKRLSEATARFDHYFKNSQDPVVGGEILVKASQADALLAMYNEAIKQVGSLQEKLNAIRAAGSHSSAGAFSSPSTPTKPSQSDLLKTDTKTALTDLLNKAGVPR